MYSNWRKPVSVLVRSVWGWSGVGDPGVVLPVVAKSSLGTQGWFPTGGVFRKSVEKGLTGPAPVLKSKA